MAVRSASEGIVLTKNNGLLPLDLKGKTVALIGHWANATQQMLGGYSGIPPYFHNPVYAAQQLGITYRYASGPVAQNNTAKDTWTANAIDAASKSDIILYFGGNDQSIESEDRDRYAIAWPQAQLTLLTALAGLGKPLVVSELGSPNDDTPLLSNANVSAILWTGFPGQSGGTAVFDVLTGKTPPAGRLPVTQYPASYVDAIPMTDMNLRPGNATPGRTYRWFDDEVLPFGHGLHYTTFKSTFGCLGPLRNGTSLAISDLLKTCGKVAHQDLCPVGKGVQVRVTNTGNTTSDYVALAFLSGEYGPKPYPIKSLAAYGRVRDVKPGMTAKKLLPPITLGMLARVDLAGNTVLYPGSYKLLLDVPTQKTVSFTLTGEPAVLDAFPQPK